jgi:hypothetical protein
VSTLKRKELGCAVVGALIGAGCSGGASSLVLPQAAAESRPSASGDGTPVPVSGLKEIAIIILLGANTGPWREQRVYLANPNFGYWKATIEQSAQVVSVNHSALDIHGILILTADGTRGGAKILVTGSQGESVAVRFTAIG